jgi:hypothetical protein
MKKVGIGIAELKQNAFYTEFAECAESTEKKNSVLHAAPTQPKITPVAAGMFTFTRIAGLSEDEKADGKKDPVVAGVGFTR